jgi:hypothetical protein
LQRETQSKETGITSTQTQTKSSFMKSLVTKLTEEYKQQATYWSDSLFADVVNLLIGLQWHLNQQTVPIILGLI